MPALTPRRIMARALRLAAAGAGWASPNPLVGAVLVRDTPSGPQPIASGRHRRAGGPHAEIEAIANAGDRARGAHLYVTLEPCSHHGRTPPCTEAILRAGIVRVTAAMADPNPRVAGKGLAALRQAGLGVEVGLMEAQARRLNERFVHFIQHRTPFTLIKMAQTLDGRMADAQGRSRWITGPEARQRVHRWRHEYDAVLVGIGTVLADDPRLDCRLEGRGPWRQPIRVVLDLRLRTPPTSRMAKSAHHQPLWILASSAAPAVRRRRLESLGARVLTLPTEASGAISWKTIRRVLGREGIASMMVEGGAATAGGLMASGQWDKLALFVAPRLLGGSGSLPSLTGPDRPLDKARTLAEIRWEDVGNDRLLTAYPSRI